MSKAYLNILLHAHLPFIRHPEYSEFLEERWLYEAISETYLPLLKMLRGLQADSVPINLTISFSPTLVSMLGDALLQERYVHHLEKMIELSEKEMNRTRSEDPAFFDLARLYHERYSANLAEYSDLYQRDILSGFIQLADQDQIDIISSPGTYPFLPFYEHYPENLRAQLQAMLVSHERVFGSGPRGIWLPEAGYFPGIEQYLKECGIEYSYSSAHSVLFSPDIPHSGIYRPARLPNGVHLFARDLSSASLVWSSKNGYPADPVYRDFYRDIGHDLPLSYVSPYIHLGNTRINTGIKYYAITGDTPHKRPYDPALAALKTKEHAQNYVFHHLRHMQKIEALMGGVAPVSTSPFSAELFGHWWFEGISWLEATLREIAKQGEALATIRPRQYLEQLPIQPQVRAIFSSWGNKGYAETWLDGRSDWMYRHIHIAIDRMVELTERFPNVTGLKRRALNQAAREVLLTQSVDWPVIMRNGTAESYAAGRIKEHLSNFYRIYDALSEGKLSTEWLTKIERKNNLFPDLDYSAFNKVRKKV